MLKLFYAEARKADGTYSKSTLSSLRLGLNRHFKATRGFDIINDSEFTDASKVFGAKCVDLKRQGLAKVEHKPPICEEDLKKLYESTAFGLNDPERLQTKVFFFEVMLYFCRRGRQSPSTQEHGQHRSTLRVQINTQGHVLREQLQTILTATRAIYQLGKEDIATVKYDSLLNFVDEVGLKKC